MTQRDAASERQVQASNPMASTWLSANAGSGKTRVLTDRVARLLLDGVEPQRILCLTYTKAAASEMQNRLFKRLGQWAMLNEDSLRHALSELGVEGRINAETLAKARRLFARAIETPGGLKIQTIHSFCASLLRRFPLEAGVTPQFAEMDDRSANLLREEIVEEMASGDSIALIDGVARYLTDEDLANLTAEMSRHRAGFEPLLSRADALALFDLAPETDVQAILAEVFLGGEEEWLAQVATCLATGTSTDIGNAAKLRALSLNPPSLGDLAILEDVLLTGAGAKEPFTAKIGTVPTKNTRPALGPLLDRLEALMLRVEAARPKRLGLMAAEKTLALHRFAEVFLKAYEARKASRGWLDFDDLIRKARGLLTDPSVAQWVLFRLDGGIDHILVDEAQDTSPEQWKVIELLAQEFTTGSSAREEPRTIFVVGDKKQSIYSFQGADLRAFETMRDHFKDRLAAVNITLQGLTLEYSFRSSQAILRLVDLTFDERSGRGLGGEVKHLAFKTDLPGRVDLWPVIEPVKDPESEDWFDPVDLVSDQHHSAKLANRIATEIRRMIDHGVQIPRDDGPRPVTEGDILILVQRRSVLFHEIIRACKAADLAIAGADRLKLGGEIAVKDITALLSFIATDEDDLSLAAALRSPLFGWTEAQLHSLAAHRGGALLWEALRRRKDEFPDTVAALEDLRDRSDFLRPYDLIERALTRHRGRLRLIARLGPEAEDGIDELLSQALAYERMEVPSLTGFLVWLGSDEVEVKRQPDSAGSRIRVMTVHGAKGLEAPVVILPDTADRNAAREGNFVTLEGGRIVWKTGADDSPLAISGARAEMRRKQEEENLRLLYVAMTRAECWLIVCAAGKVSKDGAWYELVSAGLTQAGAEPCAGHEFGPIRRLQTGEWPADAGKRAAKTDARSVVLPDWARVHAPAPEVKAPSLSPSALGGAKVLPGEGAGLSEEGAKRRGRQLHRLLEHLPTSPRAEWPSFARVLLSGGDDGATEAEALALYQEAEAVLNAPDLAPLFGPDGLAEVDIAADFNGRRLAGTIDRLIVTQGHVLAIDYKSNSMTPDRPEDVPSGILRQMGAYAEALAQIYPDRRIETAILWTRCAKLMRLPHDLVVASLADVTLP